MGVPGFSCIIDADLFLRAAAVRAVDSFRDYLEGVRIEPCSAGGALLVATDGHRMVVLRDPDAEVNGAATIRPTAFFLEACAPERDFDEDGDPIPSGNERPPIFMARRIRCDGYRVEIARVTRNAAEPSPPEGDAIADCFEDPARQIGSISGEDVVVACFPEWRRVVPVKPNPAMVAGPINPEKLVDLKRALTTRRDGGLDIAPDSSSVDPKAAPALVIGDGTIDGFGVVMPVKRDKRPLTQLPHWLAPADEPRGEVAP